MISPDATFEVGNCEEKEIFSGNVCVRLYDLHMDVDAGSSKCSLHVVYPYLPTLSFI